MDRAFEILEHPADIGFRAFGKTRAELFANAALALISIASEVADVLPTVEYPIEVTAGDPESLLVAWLSEVLYYFDGRRIAFRRFRVDHVSSTRLAAAGLGQPFDPTRHHVKLIVKAVTWHQLRIRQHGGEWTAEVYLDI